MRYLKFVLGIITPTMCNLTVYVDGVMVADDYYIGTGVPNSRPTVFGSEFTGYLDTFSYYDRYLMSNYIQNEIIDRIPSWVSPVSFYFF
jgi:hypothetical protein